nr:hypothetical protein Iba_chr12cCG6380 [Ipomoea batatas]
MPGVDGTSSSRYSPSLPTPASPPPTSAALQTEHRLHHLPAQLRRWRPPAAAEREADGTWGNLYSADGTFAALTLFAIAVSGSSPQSSSISAFYKANQHQAQRFTVPHPPAIRPRGFEHEGGQGHRSSHYEGIENIGKNKSSAGTCSPAVTSQLLVVKVRKLFPCQTDRAAMLDEDSDLCEVPASSS